MRIKISGSAQRGISLVEVPVALLIIAIIIIGAVRTFKTAGSVQRGSHQWNQATGYGLAKIHDLRASPRSQLASGQDMVANAAGTTYSRAWTVTDKSPGWEINMVVGWQAGDRHETLAMATVVR
jgi:Tfp pilus assembly protein PilV